MERIDRMKNVLISEELFLALVKYHLLEVDEVLPEIKKSLEEKLEAMERREYLEKVGIHQDFLW